MQLGERVEEIRNTGDNLHLILKPFQDLKKKISTV